MTFATSCGWLTIASPVEVVAELPDNVRETEQSFYRGIPVLCVAP